MPLIDVTLSLNAQLEKTDGRRCAPRSSGMFIRRTFMPELPPLFYKNRERFGMNQGTPIDGIQVMYHQFRVFDINVPDIWVKVQFSEDPPDTSQRFDVVEAVFSALEGVFLSHSVLTPSNFMLDLFWGPTHGIGTVNGTIIRW